MGVKFGMEEGTFGPLLHAKFHPQLCNVSPLRGEKPQNWPLSKLNTGRFALRAMLPVINVDNFIGVLKIPKLKFLAVWLANVCRSNISTHKKKFIIMREVVR